MKVLGIISEYNPFHKGHMYHLEESRKATSADFVVSVMSGNFVQRGEPAMADKWLRAKAAIECGVDLVIELPFVYACNSAEYFAYGGVSILDGLGCVDYLSFGSESGDITELLKIARLLVEEPEDLKKALKMNLDAGDSYAKAWEKALNATYMKDASRVLRGPNNILALEYLKILLKTYSNIEPITIPRIGNDHNSEEIGEEYSSATALRRKYYEQENLSGLEKYMPENSYRNFASIKESVNIQMKDLFPVVTAEILKASRNELRNILSVGEGLENKIKNEIRNAESMDELIEKINSKRYAQTKIQRMLIHILTNLDKDSMQHIMENRIVYARILALNDNGAKLLKIIKKERCAKIPVITNINKDLKDDSLEWSALNYDILATDLYNLSSGNNLYAGADYVRKPLKIQPI